MKNRNDKKAASTVFTPLEFFSSSFGIIGISLYLSWQVFGMGTRTETSDKLTYISGCLAALIFGLYSLRKRIALATVNLLSTIAWLLAVVGIAVVEHKEMSREHPMGFGMGVLLVTGVYFIFLTWYLKDFAKKKLVTFILWIPASFVIVCVCLAYWQTVTTLLESGHSEYIINEIWGPASGYNTYQEFIPQYVFLIGWLIKPILVALGAQSGTSFMVLLLTGFGYLCVLLMVWLSHKSWPTLPWPILILAVLPFSTPTPGWNRISFIGPASTLLSGPALRILGGVLVGLSVISTICRASNKDSLNAKVLFIPGFVSAVVFWNNLDFGLAAIAASIVTLVSFAIAFKDKSIRILIWYIFGHLSGHIFVFIYLSLNGGVPNWSYFGWFARQFGGGFGAVTIEMPGPVLVSVPLMMATAALGVFVILKWTNLDETRQTPVNWRAAVTASFFGSFCTFALPYYVNRSYHAGQMSILYICLAISLIASINLVMNLKPLNSKSFFSNSFPRLILAFMMGTMFLIPNPSIELDRITGGNPNGTFPRLPLAKAINEIPIATQFAKNQGKTIGFFGEGGNYVHALNGIPSANIYNSPLDMFQSDAAVQLSCKILRERNFDYLVLTESAEYTFAWNDKSLCQGLYYIEDITGVGRLGVKKSALP